MNKWIKYQWNSFFGRIILMVMLGIGLIAVTVTQVVLSMSKNVFTETYGKSQENVFGQIEENLNDFHESLREVMASIDSSWAFRLYLNEDEDLDNVQNFQNIYQMERDLEQSKTAGMERLNILVIGMKGKHYLARTEIIPLSDEEIMAGEAVQTALAEPDNIHYLYSSEGYTATSMDSDVIIVSKALYFQESREVYAVVLVTLTMEDMKQYYDYFVTDNSAFYLVGSGDTVICSSETEEIGKPLRAGWYQQAQAAAAERSVAESDGRRYTVMKRRLSYLDCTMYGVIDNDMALKRLYHMPLLITICTLIGGMILAVCLWFAGKTMNPLSQLVQKMSALRKGNFREYMPVEGTIEVQELAATYNYMLDDIQNYIEELVEIQKKQRKSEIKALQMQINPHYIYNTLASIKWLVYQNDPEKTIQTIDAFISLLRNTISNTDEFITIEQELENLENYILINHTRYGEAVKVEFYVSHNCSDCLIPKMILQPFLENAFFHGFPSGRSGTIQIMMKQKESRLEIQIIDDGIGMDLDEARNALNRENKREHFSGIGIHNVQDRLKLLYGNQYGVEIESVPGNGTTVIITLPARRKGEETNEGKARSI